MSVFVIVQFFWGCISYQFVRRVEGTDVVAPGDEFQVGKTTLGETLSLLGAPSMLVGLEDRDLLIYQRAVFHRNRLALGIPVFEIWGPNVDFSAYGAQVSYNTLTLFFTSDRILRQIVFEKEVSYPHLKTNFEKKQNP
ncbi:MAG: hypothetical protein V3S72_03175 [Desulfobacterales bacterium]